MAAFPCDALFLIAGPCVLEDDALNLRVAEHLARLGERVPGGVIFKASFDKANRSNAVAARGPGIDEGLAALERVRAVEPRLAVYRPRLQEALDKFDDGESAWLASPLMDSYHTVWTQLHQQLILMLGLTRAVDEAREERLVSGRT